MHLAIPLFAALVIATAMPAHAQVNPIKGTVHGAATIGVGVVKGTAQAGAGVVRGAGTIVRRTGQGLHCFVSLGTRCPRL